MRSAIAPVRSIFVLSAIVKKKGSNMCQNDLFKIGRKSSLQKQLVGSV